ncbi:aa3-type cytochrome c oxidase subunit IV [Rhodobacterales bacterium HKCCE4037]|nr:aa3-type cytochrome c oxidase subunit IV [Rhodobacterales bacterium HKCCE4037]
MADHDDYKHGEMDIREQEKTFAGFMKMSTNVAIVAILIVIGLAVFAT